MLDLASVINIRYCLNDSQQHLVDPIIMTLHMGWSTHSISQLVDPIVSHILRFAPTVSRFCRTNVTQTTSTSGLITRGFGLQQSRWMDVIEEGI